MAHPYKQKYNNFNGPGHQSPANNVIGKEIFKKIFKPVTRKLDDLWQRAKKAFDPRVKKWDNSVDWSKTKSKIGKLTIGGTILGKSTELYHSNERDKAQIAQDNVQVHNPRYPKGVTTSNVTSEEQEQKRILDSIIKANK